MILRSIQEMSIEFAIYSSDFRLSLYQIWYWMILFALLKIARMMDRKKFLQFQWKSFYDAYKTAI